MVILVHAHLVFHYNLPKPFHAIVISYSYPYTSLGQGIIITVAESKSHTFSIHILKFYPITSAEIFF